MMNNDRGRGASGPKKPAPMKPRYCLSPQLAPPMLSKDTKKIFAKTEDYHGKK